MEQGPTVAAVGLLNYIVQGVSLSLSSHSGNSSGEDDTPNCKLFRRSSVDQWMGCIEREKDTGKWMCRQTVEMEVQKSRVEQKIHLIETGDVTHVPQLYFCWMGDSGLSRIGKVT